MRIQCRFFKATMANKYAKASLKNLKKITNVSVQRRLTTWKKNQLLTMYKGCFVSQYKNEVNS